MGKIITKDATLEGSGVNPCTGTNVSFNGVAHLVCDVVGADRVSLHMNLSNVKGIDEEGNEFAGGLSGTQVMDGKLDAPIMDEWHATMTSKGSGTWIIHGQLHVTVSRSGDVTTRFDNFHFECKG